MALNPIILLVHLTSHMVIVATGHLITSQSVSYPCTALAFVMSEGRAWQLPLVNWRMLAHANSIMGICDATETDDAFAAPDMSLSTPRSKGSVISSSISVEPLLLAAASLVLLPLASLSWTKRISLARNARFSGEGVQP